jgi:S-adenosylmethionine decarboxylase
LGKFLGRHVLVEYYNCNPEILNDCELIEEIFLDAAQTLGVTVIKSHFHKFNPHGVSGVVVIAESHFSIHTWPELRYAAVDMFTCGDFQPITIVGFIERKTEAETCDVTQIERGDFEKIKGFLKRGGEKVHAKI